MWEVNRIIECKSWEDLIKTARYYEGQGFRCEVKGWWDIRECRLTLLDDWEIEEEKKMPTGKAENTDLYIQTPDGQYHKVDKLERVDLTPETEQDRLNQMAVDAIREMLPDNMELVMRNGR